ncbi:response regulator transcription factor [Marinobacter sp. HL-58]|uniref:LuxR C-terminal-related transcriptional regulator n=1 Tax=Marinobacter sp. HL-58 TaxID=1479237 RepID=UPI000689D985|nr:response regulator transcription factor [Marinobacter sp. HL-58]KPP97829.1 MAG: two component signal transduction system LuxR family response regulator [Marinobacter sp. HL-58]
MLKEANNLRSLEKSQATLNSLPVPDIGQDEVEMARLSKVMIADYQPLFRDAIRDIILVNHDCERVFEVSSLEDAMEIISKHGNLDIIFFDLDMPEMQGLGGLGSLNEIAPSLPIIVMSFRLNRYLASQAIGHGAMGVVAKTASRHEIVDAIRQILGGKICICAGSDEFESGNGRASSEAEGDLSQLQSLTKRQQTVLERMTLGESNKQIAYKLHLAETTVKAHVSAVLRKLNAQNRVQAILTASCLDLVSRMRK